MFPASEFSPSFYPTFPEHPDIVDDGLLHQNVVEIGSLVGELSQYHSLHPAAQSDTLQDNWPSVSDRTNHHWDDYFDRDWVLYPDSLDQAELSEVTLDASGPCSAACIAHNSQRLSNERFETARTGTTLSSYCPIDEFQAIVEEYVQRSSMTRQLEAQGSREKRPANAFLLYRMAFRSVAERVYKTKSQQHVSRFCGQSWQEEPKDIKDYFRYKASIEKRNHKEAFGIGAWAVSHDQELGIGPNTTE